MSSNSFAACSSAKDAKVSQMGSAKLSIRDMRNLNQNFQLEISDFPPLDPHMKAITLSGVQLGIQLNLI